MSLDDQKTFMTRNGEHRDLRVAPWERKGEFLRAIYDPYTLLVCGKGATAAKIESWVATPDGRYFAHSSGHPLDLIEQTLDVTKTHRTRDYESVGIILQHSGETGEFPLKVVSVESGVGTARGDTYTLTGSYFGVPGETSEWDIFEETAEEIVARSPKPFEVEAGKTYVTRDGKHRVTLTAAPEVDGYVFRGVDGALAKCGFTASGNFWPAGHKYAADDSKDLVALAPALDVETSITVGDRTEKLEPADTVSVTSDALSTKGVIAGKPAKLSEDQAYRTRDARFGGLFVARSHDAISDSYPWRVVAAQDDFMLTRSYTKRGFYISKHEPGDLDLVPDDGHRAVPVPPKAEPKMTEIVADLPPTEPTSIKLEGEVGTVKWLQTVVDAAKSGALLDITVDGVEYRGCKINVTGDLSKLDVAAEAPSVKISGVLAGGSWGPWGQRPFGIMCDGKTFTGIDPWGKNVEAGTYVTLCDHLGTEGFLVAIDEETKRGFVRHSGDTHSIKLDRLRPAEWKPRIGQHATWGMGVYSMKLDRLDGLNAVMKGSDTGISPRSEHRIPIHSLYRPKPETKAA